MGGLPEWAFHCSPLVHLDPRAGSTGRTLCCDRLRRELPYRDSVTKDPRKVTCEDMDELSLVNSIVDREAALNRRIREAPDRLLKVRVCIEQASPDLIDAEFRNQLLRLIDWGKNDS